MTEKIQFWLSSAPAIRPRCRSRESVASRLTTSSIRVLRKGRGSVKRLSYISVRASWRLVLRPPTNEDDLQRRRYVHFFERGRPRAVLGRSPCSNPAFLGYSTVLLRLSRGRSLGQCVRHRASVRGTLPLSCCEIWCLGGGLLVPQSALRAAAPEWRATSQGSLACRSARSPPCWRRSRAMSSSGNRRCA